MTGIVIDLAERRTIPLHQQYRVSAQRLRREADQHDTKTRRVLRTLADTYEMRAKELAGRNDLGAVRSALARP